MIYNTTGSLPWARLWSLLRGEFTRPHHRGAKGAESGCESGWWLSKEAKENLPAKSRLSRRVTKQDKETSRHLLPPKRQRVGRNRDQGRQNPLSWNRKGLQPPIRVKRLFQEFQKKNKNKNQALKTRNVPKLVLQDLLGWET